MFANEHMTGTHAATTSFVCWPLSYSTVRSDRGNIEKQPQGNLERAYSR